MTELPKERIEFPDGFLWGTAAAAHQVEGGNWSNDWWAWEHDRPDICHEPSGDTCDHYHRYADDFRMLGEMGHGAHRLSVEWARIEPEPDEISNAALDHYARVLDALGEHGLIPFVTLHHFTSPRWLTPHGTWAWDGIVDRFRRYAEVVAKRLGDRMSFVGTINEPQIVATYGYRHDLFPPGLREPRLQSVATRNFLAAHAAAVEAFREHAPETKVGLVLSTTDFQAVDEASGPTRDRLYHHMTGVYLDALANGIVAGIDVPDEEISSLGGTSDFVGCNYYTRARVDASASPRQLGPEPGAETTQMGYEVYPEGFVTCLKDCGRLGLPVYVTENGIGTDDDRQRIRFLARHLAAARQAIDEGVDIRGYFYWSAMDNFEWVLGYTRTFGLIAVDRGTFERRPKPSADYFSEIARTNRVEPALTARFLGQD